MAAILDVLKETFLVFGEGKGMVFETKPFKVEDVLMKILYNYMVRLTDRE